MTSAVPRPRALGILLAVNIAASVLHYLDNILFFAEYPEPAWITPHFVDAFWFFMTPFALVGYWLYPQRPRWAASALYAYALMGMLVLGHYRYAPFDTIALRIHAFIFIEVAAALALIVYVARRQWLRVSASP